MNEKARAPHTSLPKQDPAAYVPGTQTLGQYQPNVRALRAVAHPPYYLLEVLPFGGACWKGPSKRGGATARSSFVLCNSGKLHGARVIG
jgi:hypothetical protein